LGFINKGAIEYNNRDVSVSDLKPKIIMNNKIPGLIEQFNTLISLPSVSCIEPQLDMSNHAVVAQLGEWLEDLGFKVEIMPVEEKAGKFNLIAVAGKGEGGLVFSGHTDTVPYDEAGWNYDPFKLTEADQCLYGLGSADMKGFFPIVLDVLRDVRVNDLIKPLYILATCDEESTMAGAKALVASGRSLGDVAIIGEPTCLKPVNMHKGILYETIRLTGKAGHSSDPSLGINALEGMNDVINRLLEWRASMQQRAVNDKFKVPYATMNFGTISGGDSPNRICGNCELRIDLRFLPGMEIELLRAEIRREVMELIDGTGLKVEFDRIFPGVPAMETPADADIVKFAEKLAGEPASSVAFGTEAPYFKTMGMDTVVLGPGNIEVAHQINEYLELASIEPMKNITRELIKQYCM
jgi:acetylornithine deacetylase